jgi:hypothetical protein
LRQVPSILSKKIVFREIVATAENFKYAKKEEKEGEALSN